MRIEKLNNIENILKKDLKIIRKCLQDTQEAILYYNDQSERVQKHNEIFFKEFTDLKQALRTIKLIKKEYGKNEKNS